MIENNPEEDRELFKRYLDVCNQAIHRNANRFPFKQILSEAGRCADCGKSIEVLIVNDQPSEHGFCISYDQKRQVVLNDHNVVTRKKWKVTKSYLLEVISNPAVYIDNPAKIDWEWLYRLRSDHVPQDEHSMS